MASVFVSHSSKDRAVVEARILPVVRGCSHEPWYSRFLPGGAKFEREISSGLRQSIACVVVVSRNSAKGDWVRAEVARALASGIPVIPVRLDDSACCDIDIRLGLVNYVDFRTPGDGERDLAVALRGIAEGAPCQAHGTAVPPASVPDNHATLAGTTLAGRFTLAGLESTDGDVLLHRGADHTTGQSVRVRAFLVSTTEASHVSSDQGLARLAALAHPNVARLRGYGVDGDIAFCASDDPHAVSLQERLRSGGRQSKDEIREWLLHVARAVDSLHASGLLHRALHPGAVLIGPAGTAWIGDLGLARLWELLNPRGRPLSFVRPFSDHTRSALSGYWGDGPGVDRYALASMVYEAASGQPPARSTSDDAARESARSALFEAGTTESFSICVLRALGFASEKPYPSCGAFAEALLSARAR